VIPARTVRSGLERRRHAAGFTLMEIMVVVIVVGILAAIGLPSYQEAMQKGRRTDARESLMEAASRQEQYMLDRNVYTTDMTDLGFEDDPMISEERHYSIDRVATDDCAIDTETCYALRATPRADSPQSDDERCTSFTLESTGAQDAEGTDADNCW
jgi:type IV pilus assembly protein PilE